MAPSSERRSRSQNKSLAEELHKRRAYDLVLVCLLIFSSAELPLSRKRRINVNESHTFSSIGIAKLAGLFHLQQRFHGLQVIAEYEHVVPAATVGAEGPDGLQPGRRAYRQGCLPPVLCRDRQARTPVSREGTESATTRATRPRHFAAGGQVLYVVLASSR